MSAPDDQSAQRRPTGRPPLTDRATVLAAALDIGYPDLTVGAVTAAVDVKYSTFYRHFPSLDALRLACVEHHLADVTWPTDQHAGPAEHLRALGYGLAALVNQRPGIDRALLRLADIYASIPPAPPIKDPLRPVRDSLLHGHPPTLGEHVVDAVELLAAHGTHLGAAWDDVQAVVIAAVHAGPTTHVRRCAFVDVVAAGHAR